MLDQIMKFYVPIALGLPGLRENAHSFAKSERDGIPDLVTEVDVQTQQKIKAFSEKLGWQFWGEEGNDSLAVYDSKKDYLLVTDPIEGTNNYVYRKEDQWGSVLALIDIKKKEPVIGIVAHPSTRTFYVAAKGQGAYFYLYDKKARLLKKEKMRVNPEFYEYTYNNSPHFRGKHEQMVSTFFNMGKILESQSSDDLDKSRKKLVVSGKTFLDRESGALEAVRYKGTVFFKTGCEMAAVFVILGELGGKVTDGDGNGWSLGISSLIAARTMEDYDFLKNLYDGCNKPI